MKPAAAMGLEDVPAGVNVYEWIVARAAAIRASSGTWLENMQRQRAHELAARQKVYAEAEARARR